MPPADDRTLLRAAAAGDRAAMDDLVRRHGPLVLAACRRQLAGADADDAAQAVFLVLWRRAARAAAPGLPGWLVVTAQRVCATARRAARRRRQAERAAALADVSADLPNEARTLLDQALSVLPAMEREAVVRRHLLGEDPVAIASVLGCPAGTVHARTSRGLEHLRAWFARRGIPCSAAGLAALCAEECAAAEAIPASTALTCATPSATAAELAATATAFPILLVGALTMSLAAIALIAVLSMPAAVTPASEPPPAPVGPPQNSSRMYDVRDICQPEVVVATDLPTRVVGTPTGNVPPPPPPDAASVDALDACRSQRKLCDILHVRAGAASSIHLVDNGMTDEDLLETCASDTADPAVRGRLLDQLRTTLAHTPDAVIPGLDTARILLVTADQAGHGRIEADFAALRSLRQQRLATDPVLAPAGKSLLEATNRAFPGGWHTIDGSPPGSPPVSLPATLAGTSPQPFAVIWLPEDLHTNQPIAVATDGQCSLIAQPGRGITWRPDVRPAAMALYLRQRLDRQLIRAPLARIHWQTAACRAIVVDDPKARSYDVERRQLFLDLAELVRAATPESTRQTGPGF